MHISIAFSPLSRGPIRIAFVLSTLVLTACRNDCSDTLNGGLWERVYDNRTGYSMVQSADGGFLVLGEVSNSSEPMLFKLDSDGTLLWESSLGAIGSGFLIGIAEASDGSILVAGNTTTGVSLAGVARDGELRWVRALSREGSSDYLSIQALVSTSDGYVAGVVAAPSPVFSEVVKMSFEGEAIWTHSLAARVVRAVSVSGDGGVILMGAGGQLCDVASNTNLSVPATCLTKINAEGKMEWRTGLPDALSDASRITLTEEGDITVLAADHIGSLDGNGEIRWDSAFEPEHDVYDLSGFQAVPAGGFVVGTSTANVNLFALGEYQTCGNSKIIRIADDGRILWELEYGSGELESLQDLLVVGETEYLILGAKGLHPTGASRHMFLRRVAEGMP